MLTMYSTSWCGYCHRLKSQLDREGIGYTVVDIEQDPAAAEFVMSVNGGNQTVPTIRFADGSALTNPSIVRSRRTWKAWPSANSGSQLPHRPPRMNCGPRGVCASGVKPANGVRTFRLRVGAHPGE